MAIARLKSSAIAPWLRDQSLYAIWNDDERSAQVVDALITQLSEMAVKDKHKHHHRAAHLIEFLRDNEALVAHTQTKLTMALFIDTLNHTIAQAAEG